MTTKGLTSTAKSSSRNISDHTNNSNNNQQITTDECKSYNEAEAWCHRVIYSGHDLFFNLETFHEELTRAAIHVGLPYESLHSFLRNIHLTHVKKTTRSIRTNINEHLKAYSSGTPILSLAKSLNYPPYMLARLIVENVVAADTAISKKGVTGAMRDPVGKLGDASVISPKFRGSESHLASIQKLQNSPRIDPFSHQPIPPPTGPITRLAAEVMEAIDSDPLYGPRQDRERHTVGIEYEIILEQTLSAMGIPFETEAQLRIRGTARTPDILFSCPVGIKVPKTNNANFRKDDYIGEKTSAEGEFEWKVVCWIDSKALFGDVQTHQTAVLPQAETYVHRFGPGLVLYWFGHAPLERLGDGHGDVVVVGWNVPDVFVLPTGELARHGINGSV